MIIIIHNKLIYVYSCYIYQISLVIRSKGGCCSSSFLTIDNLPSWPHPCTMCLAKSGILDHPIYSLMISSSLMHTLV